MSRFQMVSALIIAALWSSTAAAGTLRVVEWNIAHGDAGLSQQVHQMAMVQPDVILLSEVSAYEPGQADQYRQLIQQETGQTWHAVVAVNSLNGSGDACMLLSRFPFTASGTHSLGPNSWADIRNSAWGTVQAGGGSVTFFAIHLDWPNDAYLQENMNTLLTFTSGISGLKVIAGDFNASDNEDNATQRGVITQIRQEYTDSLVEHFGSDADVPPTLTNGWRPDAIYHNAGIVTNTLAINSQSTLSDHYMVTAVLDVTTTPPPPPDPSACDIDGNGTTDTADVHLAVEQAIGAEPCGGDVNQDGICNVLDVQRIVRAILVGECAVP